MKTFYIHTMGCKSNQFESAIIIENLISRGFKQVYKIEDADLFILNSCTVTHKSDNEAFYLLRNAKHKNSTITTVLTGCIAQVEKEKLLELDYIDYILGNDEKLNLAKYLEKNETLAVADIMSKDKFTYIQLNNMGKTRASLKIQDGCDNRCSYCLIPFARGKSRSANIDFIINEINNLSAHGFKEVVFTGIHIGQWGKDLGLNFTDLIDAVENKTNIYRYRLGSLNPLEITDDLLERLSKSPKFAPHFHLSLQSACNKTLKSMNRFYTVEYYLEQIDKINEIFNLPFLGSDIIVGFAGETDEDFEETRQNLEKSGLTQIHTFPYSIREGTIGAKMPQQINDKIKEKRADIIKEISRKKFNAFIEKNIGKTHKILIEKHPRKSDGLLKGVSGNYINIITDSTDTNLLNTVQNVQIKKFINNEIYGEIIKN